MKANYHPIMAKNVAMDLLSKTLEDPTCLHDTKEAYMTCVSNSVENLTECAQREFVRTVFLRLQESTDKSVSAMARSLVDDEDAVELIMEKVTRPVANSIKTASAQGEEFPEINNPYGDSIPDIEQNPVVEKRQKRGLFKGIISGVRFCASGLVNFIKKVIALVKEALKRFRDFVTNAWKESRKKVSAFNDKIKAFFKARGEDITHAWKEFKNWLSRVGAWFMRHKMVTIVTFTLVEAVICLAAGYAAGNAFEAIAAKVMSAAGTVANVAQKAKFAGAIAAGAIVGTAAETCNQINEYFVDHWMDKPEEPVMPAEYEADFEEI